MHIIMEELVSSYSFFPSKKMDVWVDLFLTSYIFVCMVLYIQDSLRLVGVHV